jgi:AraC-like DNA-binding protein
MTERSDSSIPRSVLDTHGLPGKQAFTLWQEHISRYYDLRTQKEYPEVFDVRANFWHLGNVLVSDFQVPSQDWSRSRACIGRDGTDLFILQLFRKGWNGPRNNGATARSGDILIFDMAQPTDRRSGDSDALTLFLPRSLLGPHLKAPDEHNERLLPSDDPLAGLLRDHLASLHASLPEMSLAQAQAVLPGTVQLAAGGIAAYIRRRRLSMIRAALSHPSHKGQSIEAIAAAHGFNHYRSFALAFQRQFGLTPREARALAHDGHSCHQCPIAGWRTGPIGSEA